MNAALLTSQRASTLGYSPRGHADLSGDHHREQILTEIPVWFLDEPHAVVEDPIVLFFEANLVDIKVQDLPRGVTVLEQKSLNTFEWGMYFSHWHNLFDLLLRC